MKYRIYHPGPGQTWFEGDREGDVFILMMMMMMMMMMINIPDIMTLDIDAKETRAENMVDVGMTVYVCAQYIP